MRKILFACDLEGVNNVVGEPYMSLSQGSAHWEIARRQAALEMNAGAEALFDAGVDEIALWDNHSKGNNIDRADLDPRIKVIECDPSRPRMYFAGEYDAVCYFGYHTMEGTLGGVLAHTMNSKGNQYYKISGRYVGEIDIDAYIAASFGTPSCFFAGGDLTCEQAKRAVPGIITVTTKRELARNEAIFRDNSELFCDIKKNIVKILDTDHELHTLAYPTVMEKSFKRTEDAAKYLECVRSLGISADYLVCEVLGKDAHTVVSRVYCISDVINCI